MSRRTLKRLAVLVAIAVLATTFALVNRAEAASLCGSGFVKVASYSMGSIGRAELWRNPTTKEACGIAYRTGSALKKKGFTNVIVTPAGKKGQDDPGSWSKYSGPVKVKATGCVTLFARVDHAGKSAKVNKGGLCKIPKAVKATAAKKSTSSSKSAWDRLAKCESGGNWSINTGNGYYGGLQFNLSTWRAYGGKGYPHKASRAEQIRIATKLQNDRGWKPWPACSRKLGLR